MWLSLIISFFLEWLLSFLGIPIFLRIDFFLLIVICTAYLFQPLGHLLFSIILGFFLDILSGRLWGFYIATYVFTSSMIRLTSDRAEMFSYLYQAILLFLSSLVQGLVIILYFLGSYHTIHFSYLIKLVFLKSLITSIIGVVIINWFLTGLVEMEFH